MSDPRAILVILNPAAKGHRARHVEERLRRLLPEAEIALTRSGGHAEELAREAGEAGRRTVVAAGGDGTVNEVLNGLDLKRCALAVLPLGTVNVLAKEIGMPSDLRRAIEVIRRGNATATDVGLANGRRFLQLAGVGLDAEAVRQTSASSKKTFGPLGYLFAAARLSLGRASELRVSAGGEEYRGAIVLLGNGTRYGGPFRVFPRADMSDGLFDVWVLRNSGPLDVLRYFSAVVTGTTSVVRDATYLRVPRLTVSADEAVAFEVDGEPCGSCPVEFSLDPRAVRLVVP